MVIDEAVENSPSKVASGVINPITGRRLVKTWRIDELLPYAREAYTEIGQQMTTVPVKESRIVDFHTTPQMKLAFEERIQEEPQYLIRPEDENDFRQLFHYDLGYGTIAPVLLLDIPALLGYWRNKLERGQRLRNEHFEWDELKSTGEGIVYRDITARKIVFCDGQSSFEHPLFRRLPFAASKGEALWIEVKDLPAEALYKKGLSLVPWSPDVFWVGSTYEWEFSSTEPTEAFRNNTLAHLEKWLKLPFRLLDHKAAIRPANLERRPFVGFHPHQPSVGLLNGMGTKGCSLAPFFAAQLVDHYSTGSPIYPEASLDRFTRILGKA